MGSLLHLFEFNQDNMGKKCFTQKRHFGDLDTPRNSTKLQIDTSQSYYAVGELHYSYQVEVKHSDQDFYPNEASMKNLIDNEMSKHSNSRKNAPNIVARLMGMDIMPSDMKPETQLREKTKEGNFSNKERIQRCSDVPILSHLDSSMQIGSSYQNWERESNQRSRSHKMENPRRREHPQEEELQKFKKEFEAYQAARIRECSRVLELGSSNKQLLAQEDPAKVQMTGTANSRRLASQKPVKPKNSILEVRSLGQSDLKDHGNKMDLSPAENKKSFSMRNKSNHVDIDRSFLISSDQKMKSSSPSRIVILKPGPERICHLKESCVSSSGTLGERTNIEDFLEEVKERLKWELHGKTNQMVSGVRGSGIETPYSEKPSVPKHIAGYLEKHAREGVNKEIGINLIRSESTRSCRSDTQLNGPNSPEFVDRNTRRLLSARLRNIEKKDATMNGGNLRLAVLDDESVAKEVEDIVRGGRDSTYLEIERDEEEMQTRSFRHGASENEMVHRELSPRNLTRSFSAPVSGTSFGKLLLEDRHILTGAHIRRKHEDNESISMKMKVPKKEKFNLKEKVSNFRYNFTLRRKLFGRKTQSMVESLKTEVSPVKDLMSGPTVLMNTRERQTRENSTEVPPSPASVCSSTADELWGPTGHLSPISTSDVTPGYDVAVPQVFREISSNLNELRRQLHNLESGEYESTAERQPNEPELVDDLVDHEEGYVKQLLVSSGLYDGLADRFLSRWDMLSNPISNSVFEEVEETYRKLVKENKKDLKDVNGKVDHRLLLDLLNESLSTILAPSSKISSLRGSNNSSRPAPFIGQKLLDSAWNVIRAYIYPPTNRSSYYSLDGMVGRDLNSTHWPALVNDESYITGRDIESLIVRDLVEEIVNDIQV